MSEPKANIFLMMTTYNLALITIYYALHHPPRWLHQLIASLSLIIFAGYVLALAVYGYFVIPMYEHIFDRYFVATSNRVVIIAIDLIVHVLPVILFGIPSDPYIFVFACAFVATWYSIVRTKLQEIYLLPDDATKTRDMIVYGGLTWVSFIALALAKRK